MHAGSRSHNCDTPKLGHLIYILGEVVIRRTVKVVTLALVMASPLFLSATTPASPLDLSLERRLDSPHCVAATSFRLTDFVSFIGTTFKVPLLTETEALMPDLEIPTGIYSARQLLNAAMGQLNGFEWRDEGGVAHVYERRLLDAPGNLLNVRLPVFAFPHTVGEFMFLFRPCINSVIHRHGCGEGIFMGFQLPELKQGALPYGQTFRDEIARKILLAALRMNGRFYLLIAFEGPKPELRSRYPFRNWFAESLEVSEPSPMWVQKPKAGT
jgi:hypothetical protein